jgi:hypothetical protein
MTPWQAGTWRSVFKRTLGPVLICVLGFAVEVYTLAFRTTTHVESNGARQVLLKEFGAQVPITQTFGMRSNGLEGVRIRLAASGPGDITFDWVLSEQQPAASVPLYRKRQHVRSVAGESWVDILFPTIAQSIGRTYKLEVHASAIQRHDRGLSPVPASDSAGLVACVDDAMPEGVLSVGGQERSGDLVFDTIALGDTILGRFRLTTASGLDGPQPRVWLAAAAIALQNILLAAFVIYFWPRLKHRD